MMSSSANGMRHGVPCDSSPRGRHPNRHDVSRQHSADSLGRSMGTSVAAAISRK